MRRALTQRRRAAPAHPQPGFTLFELIVVICLVSVLAGILLKRLHTYQEAAQKAAMQQTAAAIKSALQMRVAAYMINGRDREIESLRDENPVDWLQEKPQNYAGQFFADGYARVKPGSWYFDQSKHELIYVPDLDAHFKRGPDGRKWIRYRTRIEYEESRETDGTVRRTLSAANFAPVQPYVWF